MRLEGKSVDEEGDGDRSGAETFGDGLAPAITTGRRCYDDDTEPAAAALSDSDADDEEALTGRTSRKRRYELDGDVLLLTWDDHGRSRWIRPVSLAFSILLLCFIAFTSTGILLRSFQGQLDSHGVGSSRSIGIDLHPKYHIFRKSRTVIHDWTITAGFRSPDGVKKKVYLVNGEFPGPTIQCRSGDRLVVRVRNLLEDEGVSIHWHGLHMRGANSMDGAVGFTQCPIPPGQDFTYDFDVDEQQSGTFWWHAHSQTQRGDGMFGGLVVHRPAASQSDIELFGYSNEVLILIGDWYHRSGSEILEWYTSVRGFGNEPVPDSLLVNGVGRFNCSMAVPARPLECEEIKNMRALGLPSNKATRLRIVNVGTLAGFTLAADAGSLRPITLDGGNRIQERVVESVGIIYPGERVDIVSKWHPGLARPRLRISLDRENFKYSNSALRPDQSFSVFSSASGDGNDSTALDSDEEAITINEKTHSNLAASSSFDLPSSSHPSLEAANQTILLYTKTQKLSINGNHPQGFMNRTSWAPQTPALISLPRRSWDTKQLVPFIPSSAAHAVWADVVINNLDDGAHPFHLHGHDFYVLASHRSEHGWGSYSPFTRSSGASAATATRPLKKDTVSVPRRGHVILRFRADNAGLWMLHCHVLFHQGSGMAMAFHVGDDDEEREAAEVSDGRFCI